MVVKDKIGRQRYILFISDRSKKEVMELVKKYKGKIRLKLIQYDRNYGIIRCGHKEKEEVINFLNSCGLRTIKTSGTIKKLRKLLRNVK